MMRDDDPARNLADALEALLDGEDDVIAGLANASAVIMDRLDALNWAGFYRLRDDGWLVLGPFQGRPACSRIAPGRGVCGRAVVTRAPVIVPDVHAFPGHIACDAASRSEMVVPLRSPSGGIAAVLDVDSPVPNRFIESAAAGLLAAAETLTRWLTRAGGWGGGGPGSGGPGRWDRLGEPLRQMPGLA